MSVITIFSGSYCHQTEVVSKLCLKTGYRLIADSDIVAEASRLSGLPEEKIKRPFSAKTSIFDKFGREKERAVVFLKLAAAGLLSRYNLLISGFSAPLIPKKISHVLRVCLIAEMKYRVSLAVGSEKLSEKEAVKRINKMDEDCIAWMMTLVENKDPWDEALYDIVIPMDKTSVTDAVDRIAEYAAKPVVQPTEHSKQAVDDFWVEAQVKEVLFNAGHSVGVTVEAGTVILTINRQVLRLKRFEAELRALVGQIAGVKAVDTKVGKDYHQSNIYRRHDFSLPDRVLLVDDEREFAESLSNRLVMCDIGAAVTFDGESALNLLGEEEPEVMILDLRIPGIDGYEVLRQVKETRPEVEVIILTSHGSDAERKKCRDLGAFAFLQKPVDLDILNDMLRKAKEKICQNIAQRLKPSDSTETKNMCS